VRRKPARTAEEQAAKTEALARAFRNRHHTKPFHGELGEGTQREREEYLRTALAKPYTKTMAHADLVMDAWKAATHFALSLWPGTRTVNWKSGRSFDGVVVYEAVVGTKRERRHVARDPDGSFREVPI
jgi:hypothetical protein